jgi:hypothetical protein
LNVAALDWLKLSKSFKTLTLIDESFDFVSAE